MTTVPIPCRVNDAVDVQPGRAVAARMRPLARDLGERRAQLVEPGAGACAHRDDGRAGNELLRLGAGELERLLVDEVGLRERDDAVLDPEQAEDRQVLVRLRPRALGGVDHEQEEVDAGRAGDHRADEPLVPGDVDHRQLRAVRQLERRVAEVDRDAARVLLRQPVGVLAGQRLDERRLAVVDVAGGADRQRHRRRRRRPRRPPRRRACRQSSRSFPSRTMPTTGGSPVRSGAASASSTAQAKLGSSASGSAPPPTRATVSSTSPPVSAASRSARARIAPTSSPQHAQHGNPLRRVEVELQRPLERGERQLVGAQRALQRVPSQLLDEVGASRDDACLRAAEQLVAGEADEVGAARRGTPWPTARRRAAEHAGAEVVHERQVVPPRDRGQLRELRERVKPTTRKFDWCTRRSSAVSGPTARS